MFPIAVGASAPRPPRAGSTPGCTAHRYLWAPTPAGWFPGEDHTGAGTSAVHPKTQERGSKGGEEAGVGLCLQRCSTHSPGPEEFRCSLPLRPGSVAGFWFFWKKQKLANGSGWFRVQRGGVSLRFEGILCSRNRKEGREGQASFARRWSDGTESIFPQASAGEGGEKEKQVRRVSREPSGHPM